MEIAKSRVFLASTSISIWYTKEFAVPEVFEHKCIATDELIMHLND